MAMSCGTACLCLTILVSATIFGLIFHRIQADAVGRITAYSAGSGILGLALVLYLILRLQVSKK